MKMKKKNNKIIIILSIIAILLCIYNPSQVNADSGFDTSYGGGYSS